MDQKIVVGVPFDRGLRTNRTAFNIDNDNFPTLINAYQWRGRVKRKRGTSLLNRCRRYFNSTNTSYSSTATITLNGSGQGNLITGFNLETNASIDIGTVTITVGVNTYTDNGDGTLSPSGTINYASGAIQILAEAGNNASVVMQYFPSLPVLGIEGIGLNETIDHMAFDQSYAYAMSQTTPFYIYNISYYKNPASFGTYTQKTIVTPLTWTGEDYQQFYTVNYQNALWTTNGIKSPSDLANIGMQFKPITTVTVTSGTTASLAITGHGLTIGDYVFINEVATTTGINFQTGYVTTVTNANTVVVTFPNASIATNGTGGICQYLTRTADSTKSCIRWYDGNPTNNDPNNPSLTGNKGWVNFMPPLSQGNFSIADLPADQYYLVGAKIIFPYKDRLVFFGPVVQTSTAGSIAYLQDTIIFSQNGTPYYTCSYTNTPSATVDTPTTPTNVFNPLLCPQNQTATPSAFFEDQTGFGGYLTAGIQQAIATVSMNEDVLLVGFSNKRQTRLIYTGNDVLPFNFYTINSEYSSNSTFSTVNFDYGAITVGKTGIILTSQTSAERLDLDIPDQIYQFNLTQEGVERVTAQRDYQNEYVFISYKSNSNDYIFNNQTLLYNYRDNSWAIFNESYTTYGLFSKVDGFTWATLPYSSWSDWTDPWNSGQQNNDQILVVAGNQQGFIVVREQGTTEAKSLAIQNISGVTVTCPHHCLEVGDYIIISDCLGVSGVNGKIFSVSANNLTENSFELNPTGAAGTYLGGGYITRMYVPYIQTKQFPVSWSMARKTRIGPQQYLLSTTDKGQISLLIFLSQDGDNAYNNSNIVPSANVTNNSLIYSTVLYTCPESTNLGLTPANTNLLQINIYNDTTAASKQAQMWHRLNTSLIGDTVQFGFTLNDAQMRDENLNSQFAEIELHGFVFSVAPSQWLA